MRRSPRWIFPPPRGVLARHWRVGPARRALDDPSYVERVLAFDGIGLRPLRPVHLRAAGAGPDLAVRWIRRGRIDADSWSGLDVPLGEASSSITCASSMRPVCGARHRHHTRIHL
jgi:hypothetical protein